MFSQTKGDCLTSLKVFTFQTNATNVDCWFVTCKTIKMWAFNCTTCRDVKVNRCCRVVLKVLFKTVLQNKSVLALCHCTLWFHSAHTHLLLYIWVHLAYVHEEWSKPVPGTTSHHILYIFNTDRNRVNSLKAQSVNTVCRWSTSMWLLAVFTQWFIALRALLSVKVIVSALDTRTPRVWQLNMNFACV